MRRSIDRMVQWFRFHGCKATLAEILSSGEPWVHEFNARKSDARRRGIAFILHRGKTPSENLYLMIEQKGQMGLAI